MIFKLNILDKANQQFAKPKSSNPLEVI